MTMDSPTDEGSGEGASLTVDGAPDLFEGKDPQTFHQEYYDRRIRQGVTRDAVSAELLNLTARAAMGGDRRVIVED